MTVASSNTHTHRYRGTNVWLWRSLTRPDRRGERATGGEPQRYRRGSRGLRAFLADHALLSLSTFSAQEPLRRSRRNSNWPLAFTRYCFTSICVCTNQSSFLSSGPPALPILFQYYCTSIIARLLGNIQPPTRTPCVCHTPYNIGNSNIG